MCLDHSTSSPVILVSKVVIPNFFYLNFLTGKVSLQLVIVAGAEVTRGCVTIWVWEMMAGISESGGYDGKGDLRGNT